MAAVSSSDAVFAVVVSFNGESCVEECIRHLLASHLKPVVVVVDNASTDSTVRRCQAFPEVEVICNDRNLGFGRANNIGISRALERGATSVLLVNQDANVEPQMIDALRKAMAADEQIGIATPMQWNEDGSAVDPTFLRYYLAEHVAPLLSDALLSRVQPVYLADSTPAAVWLCNRQFFQQVGGFDPLFFMYCEDDDLCRRARRHGFQVAVVPAAQFRHLRSFHASASVAAWRIRLRRRRIRATSGFLLVSLDPQGRGAVQLWRAAVATAGSALSSFLRHGDWIALGAGLGAVAAGLARVATIAAHRRLASTVGSHWLK